MRRNRRLFTVILFLFSMLALSAAETLGELYHIVAYYSFEVKGKSDVDLIRNMIVPPGGDPPFASREEMEKALEAKRDKLNNLRVFESVSYTYEALHADDVAIRYRVRFHIDDAISFIAVPYPKYDSNYGFMFGLKSFDKNLFGSFANMMLVINATQMDGSWDDYTWDGELKITDIPIGKSRMQLGVTGEAIQHGRDFSDFSWKGDLLWSSIPLAQTTIDLLVDLDDEEDETTGMDKVLLSTLRWNGLPWFDSLLSVSPSVEMKRSEDELIWDVDNASFTTEVDPILINGETYVFSNTMKLKFPHEHVRSITSLDLADATFIGMPISFRLSSDNTYDLETRIFRDNTFAIGAGFGFGLPFDGAYRGDYEVSYRTGFSGLINRVPMVSTTQALSFGTIKWKGNFRHGMHASLSAEADYALFSRDFAWEHLSYVLKVDSGMFLNLGPRAGFSVRGLGSYAHVPSFDWYEDQAFPQFVPDPKILVPELLRGILNTTCAASLGEGDSQKLAAVLNVDATLLALRFGKLADGFVNAFVDLGIFTDTRPEQQKNDIGWEDVTLFKTVGVEGYVILGKFPSYPIRISLGLNLDDVIDHFAHGLGFDEIERELTFGMGLHY